MAGYGPDGADSRPGGPSSCSSTAAVSDGGADMAVDPPDEKPGVFLHGQLR